MERLRGFVEFWGILGPWDKYTWMILFPPFRGWCPGCTWCALESDAIKAGRCETGKRYGYNGCGDTGAGQPKRKEHRDECTRTD